MPWVGYIKVVVHRWRPSTSLLEEDAKKNHLNVISRSDKPFKRQHKNKES